MKERRNQKERCRDHSRFGGGRRRGGRRDNREEKKKSGGEKYISFPSQPVAAPCPSSSLCPGGDDPFPVMPVGSIPSTHLFLVDPGKVLFCVPKPSRISLIDQRGEKGCVFGGGAMGWRAGGNGVT